MRGVMYFVSIERNAFLIRRSGVIEETKRYLRGLRRKPVRVLFPENDTGEVLKTTQPAERNVKRERKVEKVASTAEQLKESSLVKVKSNEQSASKRAAVMKDQIDGLRFERAFPGDKRLA